MLGHYIQQELADFKITTLGRGEDNDIVCDLTKDIPCLGGENYDLVVHCAGTESAEGAMALNLEGTRRLLGALEAGRAPGHLVIVSSSRVYARDGGTEADEQNVKWAEDEAGRSKALAEAEATEWCRSHGVCLTVVRPAPMFGKGIKGDMARMFADVVSGKYIHVRGNEGRLSVVTAYDVARAIHRLYTSGGIFNLSDGRNPGYKELAEAMSANAGRHHRMSTIPLAWARAASRFGSFLPIVREQLSPEIVKLRGENRIISNARALEAGVEFVDTLGVIARTEKDYPYEDLD